MLCLFIYKGEEEFSLELSELFITRLDIEKIWTATILGEPMDSYFTGKPREDKPIIPNAVSLTQSARHDKNRQRLESAAKRYLPITGVNVSTKVVNWFLQNGLQPH